MHASRHFLEKTTSQSELLLKLDFKNAFNSVHRDQLLSTLQQWMSESYPFGSAPGTIFGEHHLMFRRGVQQEDLLKPLVFFIMTYPLTEYVLSDLNVGYLNDGAIGGDPETVINDLQSVITSQHDYGLETNLSKCEAFIFDKTIEDAVALKTCLRAVAPGIRFLKEKELCLLGAHFRWILC